MPLLFTVEGLLIALPGGLLNMVQDRERHASVADRESRVSALESSWKTIGDGEIHGSATQAVRASILGAGPALTAADAARPIAIAGL